jgi:hypothetical protein
VTPHQKNIDIIDRLDGGTRLYRSARYIATRNVHLAPESCEDPRPYPYDNQLPSHGYWENGLTVIGLVESANIGKPMPTGLVVQCDCGSPEFLLPTRKDGTFVFKACELCTPTTNKSANMRDFLMQLYTQHEADGMLPTSSRFLYYEAITAGVVLKHNESGRRSDQDLIVGLTQLRKSGDIPWSAIVDETRSVDDSTGYASVAEGVDAFLNAARLDPWDGGAPLILTESRSLAGVLRELVSEYRVIIAPTNGQAAGFLHNDVAPLLRDGMNVIYIGDWDRAGGDIENNTRLVLEQYASLNWERLMLTEQQVIDYNLPVIMKLDNRDDREKESVETEALSQSVIVQTVRERLDELLPEPLEDVQAREQKQRERLRNYLKTYDEDDEDNLPTE